MVRPIWRAADLTAGSLLLQMRLTLRRGALDPSIPPPIRLCSLLRYSMLRRRKVYTNGRTPKGGETRRAD